MNIGVLTLYLSIPVVETIKERRNIVRSLKDKLKNKFNVAVAESNPDPVFPSRVGVTVCAVNSDVSYLQTVLSNARNLAERFYSDCITDFSIEIIPWQK